MRALRSFSAAFPAVLMTVTSMAEMRVPPGCQADSEAKCETYSGTEWADIVIHEKTGVKLVFVPAGSFMMGCKVSAEKMGEISLLGTSKYFEPEHPRHLVTLARPFYMGRFEVTNGQFARFVEATEYQGHPDEPGKDWTLCKRSPLDCPALRIGWLDAQAFCEWAGLRLPSEAEWEYACRAGTTTIFSFGDDTRMARDHVWFSRNSKKAVQPVGQKPPNAWGLYDMHGNAAEIVQDVWHDSYEGAPADGTAWLTEGLEGKRVIRGGHFTALPIGCRSATRAMVAEKNQPGIRVGFRVVLELP